MSAFLEGLGKVFGKISEQIQGRVERLKNEKEQLENEKRTIQSKDLSANGSRRIVVINNRLRIIEAILANNAKD